MFAASDQLRYEINFGQDEFDFEIDKLILNLIRLKEASQFNRKISHSFAKNPLVEKKTKFDDDLMDFEEGHSTQLSIYDEEDNDQWLVVWNKILVEQSELRREDLSEYLKNYTQILYLHIKNRIILDFKCFNIINACLEPTHINDLFDKNLIDLNDLNHFSCIFNHQNLFNHFHPSQFNNMSYEPSKLIASLTVFIYKSNCYIYKKNIIESMLKRLAVFINRENYHKSFKQVFVKHFLKAVYLNGLFSFKTLNQFLSNNQRTWSDTRRISMSDSSSLDDEITDEDNSLNNDSESLISSSDTDSDIENRPNLNNQVAKSVGKLIDILPSDEFKSFFPLNLKNLCRIVIKSNMKDYSSKSIQKIKLLTNVYKDFILFKEEVENVIKLNSEVSNQKTSTPIHERDPRALLNSLRIFV